MELSVNNMYEVWGYGGGEQNGYDGSSGSSAHLKFKWVPWPKIYQLVVYCHDKLEMLIDGGWWMADDG